MLALAAAVPVLLASVLFFAGLRSTRIAIWSLASGVAMAALFFPTPWPTVLGALATFSPTIIEILLILYAGVLLSRIMSGSGAMASISGWLRASAPSAQAGTLLVVFGIVPFAESVTGFGIGVTVGVPILRQLGHSVPRATILSLLGLLAVPWGALGPGTLLAAELARLSLLDVGVRAAWLSLPVMLGVAATVTILLRHDGHIVQLIAGAVGSSLLLWIGILAANMALGTPPAGVVGSLLPIAAHVLAYRLHGSLAPAGRAVARAIFPYAVLTVGLLLARAATAPYDGGLWARAATSPGLWLIAACLAAQFGPGHRADDDPDAAFTRRAGLAYRSWLPVGLVTLCFTVLGALLAATGMGAELGSALAGIGSGYLLLAPAVNGLAGFIAGSNTAANAMLTATQAQAAVGLGSEVLQIVAATNVAASMATMASPSRLLLAYELAVATPVASGVCAPGHHAGAGDDGGAESEARVNRWVLPRLFLLMAVVFAAVGLITWWSH